LYETTKDPGKAKVIFRKKNEAGSSTFPDYLYYKAIAIKTVCYGMEIDT